MVCFLRAGLEAFNTLPTPLKEKKPQNTHIGYQANKPKKWALNIYTY